MIIERDKNYGIELEDEQLSDGSHVFNIIVKDGKLSCISRDDANRLWDAIQAYTV